MTLSKMVVSQRKSDLHYRTSVKYGASSLTLLVLSASVTFMVAYLLAKSRRLLVCSVNYVCIGQSSPGSVQKRAAKVAYDEYREKYWLQRYY